MNFCYEKNIKKERISVKFKNQVLYTILWILIFIYSYWDNQSQKSVKFKKKN